MNAVTKIEQEGGSPLAVLNNQLKARADSYRLALPSHIKPEDLQRTVVMAAQQNPKLLEADRQSLMLSCMKAAQDGLLPDGREAALVPFVTRKKDADGQWYSHVEVQYMPMVYGLRKKILQSGEVTDITAKVVYRREAEEGYFVYEEGTEAMLRHKPMLDLPFEDAADDCIVAAYSMATYKDGSKSYEVMRRFEIDKVRESSQTGATRDKKGQARNPSGPWVDWFPEQCKKTVMRRHAKTLPMSGDVFRDVETEAAHVATLSAVATLDSVDEAAPLRLPTNDELDAQEGEGETIDQGTGEVTDSRGFTEVDEETARRLDAGEPEEEPEPEAVEETEVSPLDAKLAEIRDGIAKAKTLPAMMKIDMEWVKHRAAFDDETAAGIDKQIADRRRAIAA